MQNVYERCCGCTQDTYCCLLSKREAALRKFDSLTSSIKELGNWLFDNDCHIVAMESSRCILETYLQDLGMSVPVSLAT